MSKKKLHGFEILIKENSNSILNFHCEVFFRALLFNMIINVVKAGLYFLQFKKYAKSSLF